jgi:hypothetical protein
MSTESKSSPFGFDPSAFGPFGAVFNAYSNYMRNFGAQDFNGFGAAAQGPEAAIERATGATKNLARVQLELMGLATRRAQAYMQVPTQLARCRTPRDVADEQMAFWRTAMEHYVGSSHRLMEAWTGMVPAMCALGGTGRGATGEQRERDYINFSSTGNRETNGLDQAAAASSGGGARRVA